MRTWRNLPPHVLHRRCNSHTGTLVPLKFSRCVVVETQISPLGASLKGILLEMHEWGEKHGGRIPTAGANEDGMKKAAGPGKHAGRRT
ncbi:MAG: hypothetical protein AB7I96_06980 [Candidatus Dadabacteria bacterium]